MGKEEKLPAATSLALDQVEHLLRVVPQLERFVYTCEVVIL